MTTKMGERSLDIQSSEAHSAQKVSKGCNDINVHITQLERAVDGHHRNTQRSSF